MRSAGDLRCSLPVVAGTHAGFIDFPSGRYREDPLAPNPETHFGLTYSFGIQRWVTTDYALGYQLLSPDGRYLVNGIGPPQYSGSGQSPSAGATDIYLVDLVATTQKKIGSVPGRVRLIAYLKDGIYLDQAGVVLRLDPATGRSVELPSRTPPPGFIAWFWITSAGVWSSLIAVPNQEDQDPVLSMSLTDGSITRWYVAPPKRSVSIVGFVTPSEPLLVEFDTFNMEYPLLNGVTLMLLTATQVTQPLDMDPAIDPFGVTDSFGLWLGSPGRVWLYDRAGLIPMADVSGSTGSDALRVVGPCGGGGG